MKKKLLILFALFCLIFQGCTILGKQVDAGLIVALITAIYEIVIRLLPTGSKWLSLIEIVYKFLSWLIPNRDAAGKRHK